MSDRTTRTTEAQVDVVVRLAENEDGTLFTEAWEDFNSVREDGTPVYRWVRALGEEE